MGFFDFLKPKVATKSMQQDPNVRVNSLSVGLFGFGNNMKTVDYRFNPNELVMAMRDPIVQRCIGLITNDVLKTIKVKGQDEEIVQRLLTKLNHIELSKVILNSILGSGGDVIAFFTQSVSGNYELSIESTYWQNTQRLEYNINPHTRKIEGEIKVLQGYHYSTIQTLDSDKCIFFYANNVANDFLGITPLMSVYQRVLEKQAIINLNKNFALKGGRLDGVFSPKSDILKDSSPDDRFNHAIQMDSIVKTISDTDSLKNFVITSLPLQFTRVQSTSNENRFLETIKQINYEICASYGTPSSLVNFDETTDPNLSNAEQYADNFSQMTTDNYKTQLEQFWTRVVNAVLPNLTYEIFVSREETDESVALYEQFRKNAELLPMLKEMGITATLDTTGLERLGFIINQKQSEELTIVDSMQKSAKQIIKWNGLELGVDYQAGEDRFGFGKKLKCRYGHIRGYVGGDKEALDCYIGDYLNSPFIYKIYQKDIDGEFDEYKIMIGFKTKEQAEQVYLSQIPKRFYGGITYTTISELNQWKKQKQLTKAVQKEPPNVENLLQSKQFKQFKNTIHNNLKSQLDKLFVNLTKNKSLYSDCKFCEEIYKALPKLELDVNNLVEQIRTNLLPNILEQYNQFYDSNFKIDDLPDKILDTITQIADLTVNGNKLDYGGINKTTANRLGTAVGAIIKGEFNLDNYDQLTDTQKTQAYKKLQTQGKNIILQSRTDLISEIIANSSLQELHENLARIEQEVKDNTDQLWVGVKTVGDKRVRPDHQLNEGKYFDSKSKQPWLDTMCRCRYVYGDEDYLKKQGFKKQ